MSQDELQKLDAMVKPISFKVKAKEPKERKTRQQMKGKESRNTKRNNIVKEGVRERFREMVMATIGNGGSLSYAEVRYRAGDWRHAGERITLTVIHDLIDEMQADGLIVKELNGNSFYLKPVKRGGLDEIYAPILKSAAKPYLVQADLIMGHHAARGFGGAVQRGYRSYWEAVDWPVGLA